MSIIILNYGEEDDKKETTCEEEAGEFATAIFWRMNTKK